METEHSQWFLVYTKAREEKRAKKNLENQGFEIFLPMIAFTKLNQSKSITLKAMFPRYLFVKINTELDKWTRIQSTRGVSHLVVFGQRFAEMPNQVIAYLKSKADENDIFRQKITRHEFQEGDKLVIKKGILKGRKATFLSKTSKERVRILLRLVNQLITAEIKTSDIRQKELIETLKLSPPGKIFKEGKIAKEAEFTLQEIYDFQELIGTKAIPALLIAHNENLTLLQHNLYLQNPSAIIEAVAFEIAKD